MKISLHKIWFLDYAFHLVSTRMHKHARDVVSLNHISQTKCTLCQSLKLKIINALTFAHSTDKHKRNAWVGWLDLNLKYLSSHWLDILEVFKRKIPISILKLFSN